jgi:hypothetical protein
MKCLRANYASLIKVMGATLFMVLIMAMPIAAQTSGNRPAPGGPTIDQRDMYLREMNLKSIELSKPGTKEGASSEAIKQVKEDFLGIQQINAEIMHAYVAGEPPNYKRLSEAMAEINKRAARLNANLLLPVGQAAAAPPKGGASKGAARSPLLDLNDLINSFVTNPIFKNSDTVDATTGTKAKRDLESIIDLSDRINKSAEKLSKQ